MQWSLFVLILMGQCSFSTCHLYEYHFIREGQSWEEAQSYCREHFTDLATVSDMRDVERLTNPPQTTDAWIGLRSINESDIKEWQWSLPGEKYIPTGCEPGCAPEWAPSQPNNRGVNPQNCVVIKASKWADTHCSHSLKFICYNETGEQKYFVIDEPKNWLQAQSYCRAHHTDLVSGITQIRSEEFQSKVGRVWMWIGLFREIWSWSDGKNFSFRHWEDSFVDKASKTCAMTKPHGKWSPDNCTDEKPFYCYDDKVILIKEKKTWDEALDYCRANHRDLVSITDRHQQRWVEKRAKMADTAFVWLGMRYTCTLDLWFWVSDRLVCYDNWAQEEQIEGCDRATAMKREGKWYERREGESLNFICAL
ncbi:C-type mannose receptor 2-like [Pseudochaenichthys georgianus]|uniref:C-type mannose receptor 2-like n=1 Tax=Pseudochaenichthys georgianus TaxID=52239 RepID=UPI00146C65E6|nr:C-type mannose receptor 2-like [Pseudochaenichthys georgianus]